MAVFNAESEDVLHVQGSCCYGRFCKKESLPLTRSLHTPLPAVQPGRSCRYTVAFNSNVEHTYHWLLDSSCRCDTSAKAGCTDLYPYANYLFKLESPVSHLVAMTVALQAFAIFSAACNNADHTKSATLIKTLVQGL